MPLRITPFVKNGYYHLYNRGVAKQDIFLSDKDRLRFLNRAEKYLKKFEVTLLTYCLLPNHFHFLVRQDGEHSVAEFMRHLLVAYSMYFNKKYDRVGPVFQNRFKAKNIETDNYLLQLVRYIHQNPWELKTGSWKKKTRSLGEYQWSSYAAYLGERKDNLVETKTTLGYFSKSYPKEDFRDFVETPFLEEALDDLRPFTLETGS